MGRSIGRERAETGFFVGEGAPGSKEYFRILAEYSDWCPVGPEAPANRREVGEIVRASAGVRRERLAVERGQPDGEGEGGSGGEEAGDEREPIGTAAMADAFARRAVGVGGRGRFHGRKRWLKKSGCTGS